VARNVAENLARIGAEVRLVTAFGDDEIARWLMAECEADGMDIAYSVRAEGVPGCRYLAVLDGAGDLAAAVNDMRALSVLTPDALAREAFEGVDAVVLDTNLQGSTIARVAELAGKAPLVLDPVSTAKAPMAVPILGQLAAFKGNLREAEELSGAAGAEGAAARLLEKGVQRVFVTMGVGGVWCASVLDAFIMPALPAHVLNATGAGDAFTAGVAWGLATTMTLRHTAEWACAMSAIALESERTVSEAMTAEAVRARMEAHSR
jgi:pseudouridine kinase